MGYLGTVAMAVPRSMLRSDRSGCRRKRLCGGRLRSYPQDLERSDYDDSGKWDTWVQWRWRSRDQCSDRRGADAAGNVYVEGASAPIRKISNGLITTIAGNGIPGYSGDGGPAINA